MSAKRRTGLRDRLLPRSRRRDGTGDEPGGPAPAGGAPVPGFFDEFPHFYDSSETSAFQWRLNLRHEAIVAENQGILAGARVLDIASHDGRWSAAALHGGAASVLGIEARPELVARSVENMQRSGLEASTFEFVEGDVFRVLAAPPEDIDVVFCLGFFYHTLRHHELFARMRQTQARHLVIDTEVHPGDEPVIRVGKEFVHRQGNAVGDEFSFGDTVVTGRPTPSALADLAAGHGYRLERRTDWPRLLTRHPDADHVGDYRAGRRMTFLFTRAE
ncbi:class I SAM-dependent methyltransferase [Nocardioides sp.]|uniref:class I SAM-dependent methyltransferase n=1 Tax=Nocardioides sp. TaxID=35761 RepID=UPI0031FE5825|nr:Methyltransferase type 11 [Nocardioides sp.]